MYELVEEVVNKIKDVDEPQYLWSLGCLLERWRHNFEFGRSGLERHVATKKLPSYKKKLRSINEPNMFSKMRLSGHYFTLTQ